MLVSWEFYLLGNSKHKHHWIFFPLQVRPNAPADYLFMSFDRTKISLSPNFAAIHTFSNKN